MAMSCYLDDMASPASRPPEPTPGSEGPNIEALQILRRLEPLIARLATKEDIARLDARVEKLDGRVQQVDSRVLQVDDRVERLDGRVEKLDDRLRKQGEDVAELTGRVSQLPTTWQLLVGVVGIISAVFALLRFGLPHS